MTAYMALVVRFRHPPQLATPCGQRCALPPPLRCREGIGLLARISRHFVFGALQLRWLILRARLDETAVATARGAMSEENTS